MMSLGGRENPNLNLNAVGRQRAVLSRCSSRSRQAQAGVRRSSLGADGAAMLPLAKVWQPAIALDLDLRLRSVHGPLADWLRLLPRAAHPTPTAPVTPPPTDTAATTRPGGSARQAGRGAGAATGRGHSNHSRRRQRGCTRLGGVRGRGIGGLACVRLRKAAGGRTGGRTWGGEDAGGEARGGRVEPRELQGGVAGGSTGISSGPRDVVVVGGQE